MSQFTFIKMVKDCHQSVTLLWQHVFWCKCARMALWLFH